MDTKPGDQNNVSICNTLPVIDLEKELALDRVNAIRKIVQACQDFGCFLVVNHGVPEDVTKDTWNVTKEFFDMPKEEKLSEKGYRNQLNKATGTPAGFCRENVHHFCHPLDENVPLWPGKPARYREVVGLFSTEMRKLSMRLLELIREGLGLEEGYFGEDISGVDIFSANRFLPCVDPSLMATGLPKHCDQTVFNLVYQADVYGLEVFKDGQWLGIEPNPNTFIFVIGKQLEIITNGKFTSVIHRVMINSKDHRISMIYSIHPRDETVIKPAEALIDKSSPLVYGPFKYGEFREAFAERLFLVGKEELAATQNS